MATTALIGTAKGAFVLTGERGGTFAERGPLFPGENVDATLLDARRDAEHPTWFVASMSFHWGPTVRRSDDGGATWTEKDEAPVAFPEGAGASVARIWQLAPGPAADPDVVYAGVEPAALFRSSDGGRSFHLVEGLWNHPHRTQWVPGGGGLCLHTILVDPRDPDALTVAISTGGVYRSDDAGATWRPSNRGIRAVFLPDPDVEFGQCVHKVGRDAADPDRLYLQHHWGVYRSDDAAATWQPHEAGLPSTFGMPIVAHPRRGGTAWLIPLQSDEYRCTPQARCRVYRTRDAAESWEALCDGLPQSDAHLTVLRDAFTCDGGDPVGLWFGTRSGEVYASFDEGDHWELVASHLPPVLSVRATAS
jgi:hypothetical protein